MLKSTKPHFRFPRWKRNDAPQTHYLIKIVCPSLLLLLFMIFYIPNTYSQSATLDQWQKQDKQWEHGNLNKVHSHYLEGETVPYRIIMSDLTAGTHCITFSFEVTGASNSPIKHGIDFLTTFNNTVSFQALQSPDENAVLEGTAFAGTFSSLDEVLNSAANKDLPFPSNLPFSPAVGKIFLFGGTLTSVDITSPGDYTQTKSDAVVKVTFEETDASGNAVLIFGGHLASLTNWGVDGDGVSQGAGGIHGSPYHVSLDFFGCTDATGDDYKQIGSQDRSVQVGLADCLTPVPNDCSVDSSICTSESTVSFDLTNTTNSCINSVNGGWYTDPDFQNAVTNPVTVSDGDVLYGLITGECGNATATLTIHLNAKPTVTVNSPTKCASELPTTITATPGNGSASDYDYAWTFPQGAQDPGNVQSFSTSTAGQYCVTITNKTTGCASDQACGTLTVHDNPTVTVNSPTKCANDPAVTITATPGSGSASDYDYAWTFPQGAQDPGNVQSFSASVAGQYCVVITNKTTGCASSQACGTLTVNPNPTVYTLSSPPFCSGTTTGSITLSNSQTGVSYTLYKVTAPPPDVPISSKSGTTGSALTWTGLSAGTYYVIATNTTTNCTSTTSQITLTGNACAYSFTQGFYGNSTTNNKTCAGTNLNTLLTALLSTQLQIGGGTKGVIVPTAATSGTFTPCGSSKSVSPTSVDWLIKIMPAGSTASGLLGGNNSILTQAFNNCTTTGYLTKQTKISNVLLGQTIALSLNIRLTNIGGFGFSLGGVSLDVPSAIMNAVPGSALVYINTTQFKQLTGGCTAALGNCTNSYPLNKNVLKALSTKTVQGLLDLANEALNLGTGTGYTKNSSTFTWADLNNTIDAINRAFDRGAAFISFTSAALPSCTNSQITQRAPNTSEINASEVTVSTYPNPFNDKVRFVIQSPVSGKATLDVFNMLGQKVRTVFNGQLFARQQQVVEFNVPYTSRVNMIYILKVNGQQLVGKLISVKQ